MFVTSPHNQHVHICLIFSKLWFNLVNYIFSWYFIVKSIWRLNILMHRLGFIYLILCLFFIRIEKSRYHSNLFGGLLSLATSYSGIECLILESGTVSNTYLLIESILHDRPRSLLLSVNSFYRHENKIKNINISDWLSLSLTIFYHFQKWSKCFCLRSELKITIMKFSWNMWILIIIQILKVITGLFFTGLKKPQERLFC